MDCGPNVSHRVLAQDQILWSPTGLGTAWCRPRHVARRGGTAVKFRGEAPRLLRFHKASCTPVEGRDDARARDPGTLGPPEAGMCLGDVVNAGGLDGDGPGDVRP